VNERRKTLRGRTCLGGRIAFNRQYSTMDCVVRNLSPNGAQTGFSRAGRRFPHVRIGAPGEDEIVMFSWSGAARRRSASISTSPDRGASSRSTPRDASGALRPSVTPAPQPRPVDRIGLERDQPAGRPWRACAKDRPATNSPPRFRLSGLLAVGGEQFGERAVVFCHSPSSDADRCRRPAATGRPRVLPDVIGFPRRGHDEAALADVAGEPQGSGRRSVPAIPRPQRTTRRNKRMVRLIAGVLIDFVDPAYHASAWAICSGQRLLRPSPNQAQRRSRRGRRSRL